MNSCKSKNLPELRVALFVWVPVRGCRYLAADCSNSSNRSTLSPSVKQRRTANKLQRTKPDDPRFVGRLKTLNLGITRRRQNSRGASLLPLFSCSLSYSLQTFMFVSLCLILSHCTVTYPIAVYPYSVVVPCPGVQLGPMKWNSLLPYKPMRLGKDFIFCLTACYIEHTYLQCSM